MDSTASGDSSTWQSVVTFRLDRQTYALPIDYVVQIVEMVAMTRIPQLNPMVEGVINVHGEAVAVFKLRRHFGLPDTPVGLNTPILLVQTDGRVLGLIVDDVIDVLSLSDDQVVHLPDIMPTSLGDTPLFRGLAHISGSAALMLDPESLFLPQQLQALAQVAEILQGTLDKEPGEQTTEGKTKAAAEEPPEEPPAETKPARRRRKKAPSQETSSTAAPEEPSTEAKPARRRRKKAPSQEAPSEAAPEEPSTEAKPAQQRRKKAPSQETSSTAAPEEPSTEAKPARRQRKKAPSQETPEEQPTESRAKSTRRRRKKRAPEDKAVDAADEEGEV
jgi:purine-binding chemotaxis protein CheW